MKQCYKPPRMRLDTLARLAQVNEVVEHYQKQGLRLTLRQLYYQLVTQNIIANEEREYKRLSSLLSKARLAGLTDWDAIEDRIRRPERPNEFADLDELVKVALDSYRRPRMEGQPNYVELWVEKDALAGVLAPIAKHWHITLMVNRGYSSQSAMYEAACRIDHACRNADGVPQAEPIILYLGDLDPSGEDMVRDVRSRLNDFLWGYQDGDERISPTGWFIDVSDALPVQVRVEKIAITPEQVAKYGPPPNPTKLKDSRAAAYIAEHGHHSWEVDALRPEVLQRLIEARLGDLIDQVMVDAVIAQEMQDRSLLRKIVGGVS